MKNAIFRVQIKSLVTAHAFLLKPVVFTKKGFRLNYSIPILRPLAGVGVHIEMGLEIFGHVCTPGPRPNLFLRVIIDSQPKLTQVRAFAFFYGDLIFNIT